MKIILPVLLFLCCTSCYSHQKALLRTYTTEHFLVHLDSKIIPFEARYELVDAFEIISEDCKPVRDIYPQEIKSIELKNGNELLLFRIDSQKSQTRGLLYVQKFGLVYKVLDFAWYPYDFLQETVVFDIDKDGRQEIFSVWADESTFFVRIDTITQNGDQISMENQFLNESMGNPDNFYKDKLFIENNELFVFYQVEDGSGHVVGKVVPDKRQKNGFGVQRVETIPYEPE